MTIRLRKSRQHFKPLTLVENRLESRSALQMTPVCSFTNLEVVGVSKRQKETARDKFISTDLERYDSLAYVSKCLCTSELHSVMRSVESDLQEACRLETSKFA